jgi:hypothetical protein
MTNQNTALALFFETLAIYGVYSGMNLTSGARDWETARRVALAKSKTSTSRGELHSRAFSLLR